MRKEGIGYLPQFDNTEHTIYKLTYCATSNRLCENL